MDVAAERVFILDGSVTPERPLKPSPEEGTKIPFLFKGLDFQHAREPFIALRLQQGILMEDYSLA